MPPRPSVFLRILLHFGLRAHWHTLVHQPSQHKLQDASASLFLRGAQSTKHRPQAAAPFPVGLRLDSPKVAKVEGGTERRACSGMFALGSLDEFSHTSTAVSAQIIHNPSLPSSQAGVRAEATADIGSVRSRGTPSVGTSTGASR